MNDLSICLFPLRLGPAELNPGNEGAYVRAALTNTLAQLASQLRMELVYADQWPDDAGAASGAERSMMSFAEQLPSARRIIDDDVEAGFAADPVARSVDDVLLSYPSLTAILYHRLAHILHGL